MGKKKGENGVKKKGMGKNKENTGEKKQDWNPSGGLKGDLLG